MTDKTFDDDEELSSDGPWNQPAMLDARGRQKPVSIGGVPATAALIGEPFLRGSRPHRALLITPVPTDQHDTAPLPSLKALSPQRAATRTVADANEGPRPEATLSSLFNEPAEDDPATGKSSAIDDPHTEQGTTRKLRVPLLITAAAFVLSVGIPIALHASSPKAAKTSTRSPLAASSTPNTAAVELAHQRAQLLNWARSYVPADSVIVTDQTTLSQLRTAGFSQVSVFGDITNTPLQTIDYILNVPAASAAAAGPGGRVNLLAGSQPLAQFGSTTAREYFPQPAAGILQRKTADVQLRKQGGTELALNPAIVPDADALSVLVSGQLDLRAQNVLNLLASSGTVYVTDPTLIPAEQQLDQPVRSIVITTDGTSATQNILSSMITPYRPDSIVQLSQRKLRLTWSPAIAPIATVGQ